MRARAICHTVLLLDVCYAGGMELYLQFAKQLAIEAGTIMLQHFKIGVATTAKPQAGNTPVTIADEAINALVIAKVRVLFPTHAVLGEEQSLPVENADYTWVCDPIDGTAPFAAGIPINVFAIALVSKTDGQPVLAVIYDPYMKRLYHAVKGKGAFMNDSPIQVNAVGVLADAAVDTTSSRSEYVDSVGLKTHVLTTCYRQMSIGSVLYAAAMVANGQIAAQLFVGTGAHDVAAAKLIVEEAGGTVTDIFGRQQRYDQKVSGAIISNGHLHEALVRITNVHKIKG